jgi:hypothetical protein
MQLHQQPFAQPHIRIETAQRALGALAAISQQRGIEPYRHVGSPRATLVATSPAAENDQSRTPRTLLISQKAKTCLLNVGLD